MINDKKIDYIYILVYRDIAMPAFAFGKGCAGSVSTLFSHR